MNQYAIKAEGLRKDYPGLVAVKNLSFTVERGVVHGFLGPNGAGKSTTIRMICGLLRPTSGHVLVEGFDPSVDPHEVKKRVGFLPENPPLYREMTVREYLRFTARLHEVAEARLAEAEARVIEALSLEAVAGRLIGNLSKGYRQRVGIAQALIHQPELVILDEPTAGLDPESVVEVRSLIKKLKRDKTILFSSHLLHEVEEVSDTISIISHGELLACGPLSEVRKKFQPHTHVSVEVAALSEEALARLRGLSYIESLAAERTASSTQLAITLRASPDGRAQLVRDLVSQNIDVLSFQRSGAGLEDIFLSLTRGQGDV